MKCMLQCRAWALGSVLLKECQRGAKIPDQHPTLKSEGQLGGIQEMSSNRERMLIESQSPLVVWKSWAGEFVLC